MRPIMITARHSTRKQSVQFDSHRSPRPRKMLKRTFRPSRYLLRADTQMRYVNCPICQVNDTKPYGLFGYRGIVQCRACGLIYVNPQVELSNTRTYFQTEYVRDAQFLDRELGAWRLETWEREARMITKRKPPGRILDVGCSGGDFMSILAALKWDCYGVEPSQISLDRARRRGFHVYEGLLSEIAFPQNEVFDVVTYLDAFPFSATPGEDLETLYRLLKSDGLLLIEIPGLAYRMIRNIGPVSLIQYGRWSHLSPDSRHLFYFSTPTLAKLLRQHGFEIQQIGLEPALTQNTKLSRLVRQIHHGTARMFMRISLGKLNLGGKVVYVCTKS